MGLAGSTQKYETYKGLQVSRECLDVYVVVEEGAHGTTLVAEHSRPNHECED